MSLETILSRIASGGAVSQSEILPYLSAESREERANVNRLLADACMRSGGQSQLRHGKTFIRRAWLLSRFSAELLPLYEQIHAALGDVQGIRDAYKRLGMTMAARGAATEAIRYFNLWQYAYQRFERLDRFEYDIDILDCVDRLAAPDRLSRRMRPGVLTDGKIRVAYLAAGATEVGSPIMKVIELLAKHHDRERFEPVVFVPETGRMLETTPAGREHLDVFRRAGCELIVAPDVRPAHARLVALGRLIYDAQPDVLITSAALATFDHAFIAALRPAPLTIGLIQGPPQQFAPLTLDWGISLTRHPILDCPVDCALAHLEFELPSRRDVSAQDRSTLDVPGDAVVLLSGGRHVKFQSREFWQAIAGVLRNHPRAYYVAMGVEEAQVPFLSSVFPADIRSRLRCLGWRGQDYLRLLAMADIVIDTFPSGGGSILFDAMALGLPIVSFKNDYLKEYDQVDWSPAEEFIHVPDLLLERGDFDGMRRLVSRLIQDQPCRVEAGLRCQEDFGRSRRDPMRALRKYEAICLRVIEHALSNTVPTDGQSVEVSRLAVRVGRSRAPWWVAGGAAVLKRALRFGERLLDRVATG